MPKRHDRDKPLSTVTRRRRAPLLGLIVCWAACDTPARPSVVPQPSPTPFVIATFGKCFGDLSELDSASRVFPGALVRDGVRCTGYAYAQERHCPGVYVAIAQGDEFLGGTTRYFDGNRELIALSFRSDFARYCNSTSFDKIYGTIPPCPTQEIVTDLCRR